VPVVFLAEVARQAAEPQKAYRRAQARVKR
jgi:hypothetical protein